MNRCFGVKIKFLDLFSSIVIAGTACYFFSSTSSVVAAPSSCIFSYVNQKKIKSEVYSINYKSDAKDKYTRAVVAKALCNKFEEKFGKKIEEVVSKYNVYDVSRYDMSKFKGYESLILRVDASSDIAKKVEDNSFLGKEFFKITSKEFNRALDEIISDLKSNLSKFSKFKGVYERNFVLPDVFDDGVDSKTRSDTYYNLVISPILSEFFPNSKLGISDKVKGSLPEYSAKFLKFISGKACNLLKARIKKFEKLKNKVKMPFSIVIKYFSPKGYVPENMRPDAPLDVSDFIAFLPSSKGFNSYSIDELLAVASCIFSFYKIKSRYLSYVKSDLKELAELSKYKIPSYYGNVVDVVTDIVKNCKLSSKINEYYIKNLEDFVDFSSHEVSFDKLKDMSQLKLLNPEWACSLYKILKTIKLSDK